MPLDTIKTQMQCNGALRTPLQTASTILRTTGPASFYAGVQPFMAQCAGKAAIRFYTFEYFRRLLGADGVGAEEHIGRTGVAMLGGLGAGLTEAVLWTAPMERLKVLRQTEAAAGNAKGSGGLFASAAAIARAQGVAGLYRGCVATCLRQGSSHMTRFAVYTPIREKLLDASGATDPDAPPAWVSMIAGGLAGSFSVVLNNPVDVIKSRIQAVGSTERGCLSCARNVLRKEGMGAFAKGLSARVPRLFFSQAITFTVYERVLMILSEW
jgi:solute carrier family 25 citrate transporter 1